MKQWKKKNFRKSAGCQPKGEPTYEVHIITLPSVYLNTNRKLSRRERAAQKRK